MAKNLASPVINESISLFKRIIAKHKMQKFNIKGWESEIILPYLTDQEGWLGIWMLKSDEISTLLTGKRMWDVAYQADPDCLEGMRPVHTDELKSTHDLKTYSAIPLFMDDELKPGLKFKLCEHAFFESLSISGNEVSLNPIFIYGYELDRNLNSGEVLPFPSSDRLLAKNLNEFNFKVNNNLNLSKNNAPEKVL